jgi:hypothetical protein
VRATHALPSSFRCRRSRRLMMGPICQMYEIEVCALNIAIAAARSSPPYSCLVAAWVQPSSADHLRKQTTHTLESAHDFLIHYLECTIPPSPTLSESLPPPRRVSGLLPLITRTLSISS